MIGVYKITNSLDGTVYIGGSIDIEKRIKHHFWMLENNKHYNYQLQESFNLLGRSVFTATVLETCTAENVRTCEQKWMEIHPFKYNLYISSKGGSCPGRPNKMKGRKFSEEARQNMSKGSMGQRGPWSYKKVPQEMLDKLQEGRKRYQESVKVLDARLAAKEEPA